MKKLFLYIASLLCAVGTYAEQVTLTLYANGCDSVNTITCPAGQQLRLTAEAILEGSRFERWSDGVTDNPRLVTVSQNSSLTAIYTTQPRMFMVLLYANGCDSVNTIICPEGQQLRLTAEAILEDSQFDRWSDGVTDNPRIVVVNQDTTLTAIYNSIATAIIEVESQSSQVECQKFLRNGVLLIEQNGIYYNAQGTIVE